MDGPPNRPHYYIGHTRGLLGGLFFGSLMWSGNRNPKQPSKMQEKLSIPRDQGAGRAHRRGPSEGANFYLATQCEDGRA